MRKLLEATRRQRIDVRYADYATFMFGFLASMTTLASVAFWSSINDFAVELATTSSIVIAVALPLYACIMMTIAACMCIQVTIATLMG